MSTGSREKNKVLICSKWKYIPIVCLVLVLLSCISIKFNVIGLINGYSDEKHPIQPIANLIKTDGESPDTLTDTGYLLTLFLRMHSGTLELYSKYFLFSLELFWPGLLWKQYNTQNGYNEKTKLLIVLDDESFTDHSIVNFINESFPTTLRPYFDLYFEFEAEPNTTYIGHDRQQWSMFYADKYMNDKDEYIGFVDTDTIFQTVVFPSDLFHDIDHPIMFGQSKQYGIDPNVFAIANNTIKWLNIKREPFRCMSNFPVILHKNHLLLMREAISSAHNNIVFKDILYTLGKDPWSQFTVFCSYLWNHQQDEYKFVIERTAILNSSIDYFKTKLGQSQQVIPFIELYEKYKDDKTDLISFEPHIRVSNHAKYISKNWQKQSKNAILYGYCNAVQFSDILMCNKLYHHIMTRKEKLDMFLTTNISFPDDINPYLFYFEYQYNFLMHPNVETVFKTHSHKLSQYTSTGEHKWNVDAINVFMNSHINTAFGINGMNGIKYYDSPNPNKNNNNNNNNKPPHNIFTARIVSSNIPGSSNPPGSAQLYCPENNYECKIGGDGDNDISTETIWYEGMDTNPNDPDWIIEEGASISYKEGANKGSNSDCPETNSVIDYNPCWAICGGSMVRQTSAKGYTDISLTYSIDPWAMLGDNYCLVLWSTDDKNYKLIHRKYNSDDEIVDQTESLGNGADNQENLYIKVIANGTSSNCCYLADFYLNGKGCGNDCPDPETCGSCAGSAYQWTILVPIGIIVCLCGWM
eukprot:426741_1